MRSIFTDKNLKPTIHALKNGLGETFTFWNQLAEFTKKSYPKTTEEWRYSGEKTGWGFRISDTKRVLIYLLPRDKFFKVAFVFGQKATDKIMLSEISASIKKEIREAKVYAEGRGIRIEVKDDSVLTDIRELIRIKISN